MTDTSEIDTNRVDAVSESNDSLGTMPLLDFRPRELCLGSWGYGFYTGGLVSFGTLGVLDLSWDYLLGAAIFAVLGKLAHEALPLRA